MLNDFLKYIDDNRLITRGDRVLLAVSGGIDSMVMAHLFIKAGIETGIAHCNFCLRDKESDMDEELVKEFANENGIVFFSKRFETKAYAEQNGISVQMAARELRYKWFEEIRNKNGFSSIAVGHNLNDNIETFLINLIRGTGITGLTGMRQVNNRIIRPLLFATRQSIADYCKTHQIIFREDKSNTETKYTRNKIRHLVIPILKEINPSVEISINDTAERLSGSNEIVTDFINDLRGRISKQDNDIIAFNINLLQNYLKNSTILYELFKPYGITNSLLNDLYKVIKGRTGTQLFTPTHRILKNRKEIIISGLPAHDSEVIVVNNLRDLKKHHAILKVRAISISKDYSIPSNNDTASIDLQKITFPLIIRKWHAGDYFYPLGMTRKKKLSDYFIDRKYSRVDKENALILESGGKIIWIIGERIDNRFRITGSTRKILLIEAS
ncbi:MAG: tRNA lysidine(34) synthetase TilS [Bacteroidales bacterium]|nr:tRNA lysidine(34) synthetase TilS [Bacteroidales bacterium]